MSAAKLASFPGSTPQLFSQRVEIWCEKSWGVEPGNEATANPRSWAPGHTEVCAPIQR